MPLAEKGGAGKGAAALVPASAHRSPGARQRSSYCLLVSRAGSLNVKAIVHAEVLRDDEEPIVGGGGYDRSHCASGLRVGPEFLAGRVVFDENIVDLRQIPVG